jgi:hypothetical protein
VSRSVRFHLLRASVCVHLVCWCLCVSVCLLLVAFCKGLSALHLFVSRPASHRVVSQSVCFSSLRVSTCLLLIASCLGLCASRRFMSQPVCFSSLHVSVCLFHIASCSGLCAPLRFVSRILVTSRLDVCLLVAMSRRVCSPRLYTARWGGRLAGRAVFQCGTSALSQRSQQSALTHVQQKNVGMRWRNSATRSRDIK